MGVKFCKNHESESPSKTELLQKIRWLPIHLIINITSWWSDVKESQKLIVQVVSNFWKCFQTFQNIKYKNDNNNNPSLRKIQLITFNTLDVKQIRYNMLKFHPIHVRLNLLQINHIKDHFK